MERLKEELENMNDLMEQKDTLTQKLEVSDTKSYYCSHDYQHAYFNRSSIIDGGISIQILSDTTTKLYKYSVPSKSPAFKRVTSEYVSMISHM